MTRLADLRAILFDIFHLVVWWCLILFLKTLPLFPLCEVTKTAHARINIHIVISPMGLCQIEKNSRWPSPRGGKVYHKYFYTTAKICSVLWYDAVSVGVVIVICVVIVVGVCRQVCFHTITFVLVNKSF